jgi:BlaI family transcriptional regulator, penicillinase repressor
MARTARDVTEAELAILRVLWDGGPATVRTIAAELAGQGNPAQPATVQKLLERLEEKECVGRDRSGTVQTFHARSDRNELIGRRLRGIAEELCEGSMTPLLSHLVKDGLNPNDRKALRDLIDRLDDRSPNRKRGG